MPKSPMQARSPALLSTLVREVDSLVSKYKLAPQIIVHAITLHGPDRRAVERYLDAAAPRFN